MAQDIRLSFGVDLAELVEGLETAKEAVAEAAAQMKESFAVAKEGLAALSEGLLAIGAIMAGGKVFGEVISSTVNLNVESAKLGRTLGISATEASVLRVAMEETHVTQDQFNLAAQRVLRTLNTNEGAFKELGVATRDANGNFRPLGEIVLDTNERLKEFKEGTDRGVEAAKIYGRSWAEVAPTLRVTREAQEEARDTAEQLGLAVTAQSEALTSRYRASVVGVKDVIEGLFNAVGQQLLPILSEFGEWFRSVGPAAIDATRKALAVMIDIFSNVGATVTAVTSVFSEMFGIIAGPGISATEFFVNVLKVLDVGMIGIRTSVQLTIEYFQKWFDYTVDLFQSWAQVAERALHLDWEGVRRAWADGNKLIEKDWEAHNQNLVRIAEKAQADIQGAVLKDFTVDKGTPTKAPDDGERSEGGADHFDRRLSAWIRELDREYAELKKKHEAEIEIYRQAEAEFAKAAGARVAIAEQEAEAEARAYGRGSPEFEKAQLHLVEVQRQAQEQLAQMAEAFQKVEETRQQQALAADEKLLQQKYQQHLISNSQLEQAEVQLENRRNDIAVQGVRDRMALIDPTHDPVQYAKLTAQIESLELEHQNKLREIQAQATQRAEAQWTSFFQMLTRGFGQSISRMIEGTESFKQGMLGLFRTVLDSLINFLVEWGVRWAAQQILNLAVGKTAAAGQAQAQAGVAGAAGVASFAGAPWPIDLGAPAFGAAMFSAASAYTAAAAAEGGYDIPAYENPVTQLHQREMVLPAQLADGFRNIIETFSGAGIGSATNYNGNVNISAFDARSVGQMFKSNRRAIADAARLYVARGGR